MPWNLSLLSSENFVSNGIGLSIHKGNFYFGCTPVYFCKERLSRSWLGFTENNFSSVLKGGYWRVGCWVVTKFSALHLSYYCNFF